MIKDRRARCSVCWFSFLPISGVLVYLYSGNIPGTWYLLFRVPALCQADAVVAAKMSGDVVDYHKV